MKYFYFIWKNLTRKKVRTTLTMLSVLIAFILYGLLNTLNQAFTMGAELAGADRLVTIHKISLINFLPMSYVDKAKQLEGVKNVTHATWFGGYYQEPRNQFAQFPVEADLYFDIYPEVTLPDEQMQAWKRNRQGAVVGENIMKRYHWKVGDRITIFSTIFPRLDADQNWEFVIEGVFKGKEKKVDTSYMLFHSDYFEETKGHSRGQIGWLILQIENPKNAAAVAKAVDALFANSMAETKTSTEKAFAESFARQLGDIGTITAIILSAVFFTMLLVAGNTMAQSVRERIPELAVMKTIGFSNHSILFLILAESILIALIGGGLGLLAGSLIVKGVHANLGGFLPGFVFSMETLIKGVLMIVLLGLIAGMFPALQGMRLSIVNALGRR